MQWKPWIVFRNIISGYRLNATAITKVDLTFKTLAFLQSTKLMSYLSRILPSLRRSNSHLFYVSYWTRTDTGDWYEQIVKGYVITYLLLMLFALVIVFANSLTKINLLSGSPCIKWTDTILIEVMIFRNLLHFEFNTILALFSQRNKQFKTDESCTISSLSLGFAGKLSLYI